MLIIRTWTFILICLVSLSHNPAVLTSYAEASIPKEYFVSPDGNDKYDGTSPGRPWRSLERVNRAILKPGDTVRFKAGCVWYGQLIVKQSGAKDKPITFTGYGAGRKPRIAATNPLHITSAPGQFRLAAWGSGGEGATIYRAPIGYDPYMVYGLSAGDGRALPRRNGRDALKDKEWYYDSGTGYLYVKCSKDLIMTNQLTLEIPQESSGNTVAISRGFVAVDGLEITGGRRYAPGTPDGSGIAIMDGSHDCVIRNCSILGGPTTGIEISKSRKISVLHNAVYDCGNAGVYVTKESTDCEITGNKIYRCGNQLMSFENPGNLMDKGGICVGSRCASIIIRRNDIYECGLINGQTTDPAIEIYRAMDVHVIGNYIHDNYFGAVTVEGDKQLRPNARVENNIIVNNQRNRKNARAVVTFFNTSGSVFMNNTYYNNYVATGYGGIMLCGENADLQIKYNIFSDNRGFNWNDRLLYVQAKASHPGLEIDYNCWYRPGGANFINYEGNEFAHDQFERYQKQSKQERNSIFHDPQFADPEKGNFRLKETSPCASVESPRGRNSSQMHTGKPMGAIKY